MMPRNFKFICIFYCILTAFSLHGQLAPDTLQNAPLLAPPSVIKPISVGFNLGVTNGLGIDAAYRFAKHWSGKIAVNYADFTKNNYTYDIVSTNSDGTKNVQTISFDAAIRLSNLALSTEYSLGRKGRFRFIGGLAFFFKNTVTVGGQAVTAIKYKDLFLTPDDIGSGSIQVGFNTKVAPFIGFGLGRLVPNKRLNFSFDFGTHYKSEYRVAIKIKPGIILAKSEENAAVLTRNFNQKWYGKFWPYVNLRWAYRIR
jgi:hypothetical protein